MSAMRAFASNPLAHQEIASTISRSRNDILVWGILV